MADALLIYNPAAGAISVRPFIAGVIRALNDHAGAWRWQNRSMGGIPRNWRVWRPRKIPAVFAIGGDGTAGRQPAADRLETAFGCAAGRDHQRVGARNGHQCLRLADIRALRQNAVCWLRLRRVPWMWACARPALFELGPALDWMP